MASPSRFVEKSRFGGLALRSLDYRAVPPTRLLLPAALIAACVAACGGTITADPDSVLDTGVADSGLPDAPRDTRVDSAVDSKADTHVDTAFDTALDTWIEPECPDAGAPIKDYKCDPFAPPPGGCKPTEACFPYVEYPSERCKPEIYHTRCFPAGKGKQGDPCGSGGACAGGFVCVATGVGNQCAQMCKPGKLGACADGYVCSPTDVPDIGACL